MRSRIRSRLRDSESISLAIATRSTPWRSRMTHRAPRGCLRSDFSASISRTRPRREYCAVVWIVLFRLSTKGRGKGRDYCAFSARRRSAHAAGHERFPTSSSTFPHGASSPETRPRCRHGHRRASVDESCERRGVGSAGPRRGRSARSSVIGTRSPSTRSSATPARPTPKRSCGSPSNRPPCTTPVVGITRQYELYNWNARGPRGASPQAAAAVAAHDVLLEYFPASQTRLDTALTASARCHPRWDEEGAGDPLWRTRRRPAHRAARGRRPIRADYLRCPARARRLAPDPEPDPAPAPVYALLRSVAVPAAAAAARLTEPVPTQGPLRR